MKFNTLFGIIVVFGLTVSTAMATPIYNLGLPCGPGNQVCDYKYTITNPLGVYTDGDTNTTYGPGLSNFYEWSKNTVVDSMYWEDAANEGNGKWWQSKAGFSTSTVDFNTVSDYFTFGCCEPDWWNDIFTKNNNTTIGQNGWVETLISDGTTITYTYSAWGNSTDYWDTYSKQSGASYSSNGSSSFESIYKAKGKFVSDPWNVLFTEQYSDPANKTPEPSGLFLSLGGGLMLVGSRLWRRKKT